MTTPREALLQRVAAELALPAALSPAMAAARQMAGEIVAEHGASVAAVLFYGSCRRDGDASGLLDLYVLYDGHRAFFGRAWLAGLTALLPPTILSRVTVMPAGPVRAKVAVLSRGQFAARCQAQALDTTIWARFCQPATLLHARDAAAATWTTAALADAVTAAASWAARLGPAEGEPATYWRNLFARTYGAELRVERSGRPSLVYEASAAWFDAVLPLALASAGPMPSGWRRRRAFGKALNIVRLVKAAFTFSGGADYLAWKIERHSGVRLELTPWQQRHPVVAAPLLLWRLWRRGAVR
jgi:hypothetical protein